MKRGDIREISADGKMFKAEYIGKGMFAKVYRALDGDRRVYAFVTGCYMKEAISDVDHVHVPAIMRHNDVSIYSETQVFSMPFYNKLTAKDKDAWETYKELKDACEQAKQEIIWPKIHSVRNVWSVYGMDAAQRTIDILREKGTVSTDILDALQIIWDNVSNYGQSCTFEFAPRNLAVDDEGNLILLDIAFDTEKTR